MVIGLVRECEDALRRYSEDGSDSHDFNPNNYPAYRHLGEAKKESQWNRILGRKPAPGELEEIFELMDFSLD